MNEKKQDRSFHTYIRGIILIGFALLILAMIVTGNIVYYIAPKMMPFIYFATVVFLFLGAVQIIRSTKKDEEEYCDCGEDHSITGSPLTKILIYSIFIVPIVAGFVIPDRALDSSVAANRGIQYGSGVLNKPITTPAEAEDTLARAAAYLEDPDAYFEGLEENLEANSEHFSAEDFYTEEGFNNYYLELAEELKEHDTIVVTEENYLDVMTVLDIHMNEFLGKEIEILGFVYREEDFDDNQMVVARFAMTCCVADVAVYGTMIEADEASQYENDTWVRVSGTLNQTTYGDFAIPLIQLREITVVEEPDTPYVYPSFR
ncbi:TIGR03943 family putative permease subunit [Bacillus alkalicellulosilyticus]|uniref:TIGR03943 family putative permease subunit n=1 Tax=Alkalihalobacterium alkalicellulosilyticum TaxID=1912214 RepID=UPI0009977190|nr:TIGR03943 family protein [Bacillus alkalicellulosilyticus]